MSAISYWIPFFSEMLRMLIPADLVRQGYSPDDWKKVNTYFA